MKTRLAAVTLLILVTASAFAHRTDEYLQATALLVGKDRIEARMRLAPGIAVASRVILMVDADRNGVLSRNEQRQYALRVLRDLSLSVDGHALQLRLVAFEFPDARQVKGGNGAILLEFHADVRSRDAERKLVFENRHQRRISAYLANGLVPGDPDIRIRAQKRNHEQSLYELDYIQASVPSTGTPTQASKTP
jgi:hypothetical protein